MERTFSAAVVVLIWGVMNALMVALLAGFVTSGFGGGMFVVAVYCASAGLVFLVALLVWLGQRWQPWLRGLRVPPRPASALLLAAGAALIWLALPFGSWVAMLAVFPLGAAAIMEITARLDRAS
jgi:hypothetical protein